MISKPSLEAFFSKKRRGPSVITDLGAPHVGARPKMPDSALAVAYSAAVTLNHRLAPSDLVLR